MKGKYKVIVVSNKSEIGKRLKWEKGQLNRVLVQSVEDPEYLYHPENFIQLCIGCEVEVVRGYSCD